MERFTSDTSQILRTVTFLKGTRSSNFNVVCIILSSVFLIVDCFSYLPKYFTSTINSSNTVWNIDGCITNLNMLSLFYQEFFVWKFKEKTF